MSYKIPLVPLGPNETIYSKTSRFHNAKYYLPHHGRGSYIMEGGKWTDNYREAQSVEPFKLEGYLHIEEIRKDNALCWFCGNTDSEEVGLSTSILAECKIVDILWAIGRSENVIHGIVGWPSVGFIWKPTKRGPAFIMKPEGR